MSEACLLLLLLLLMLHLVASSCSSPDCKGLGLLAWHVIETV